ncbi:nitric oxide-associated protein 1 isoform X1 [Pogonomyrmex barbatus]|uniref:Nitric oxide-associated protein 1 isoform X1 n=1 Tax=Pogonomyrmex barbatus TaxID=144034 RepID=A0A6I9WXV5_9HYME|nr:nitric oxide-associated protein 1 isoform X1 [Pogonomyrmex barbatus]
MFVNNIKLITFTKHSALKTYIDNTYCYLKTCRHVIQAFNYSTKCDAKANTVQSSLDSRVVALREKLIYCDYLDYQKVKMSYMKRYLLKKKTEYAKRNKRIDTLVNLPVYSVLLDAKNDEDTRLEQKYTSTEDDLIKPVYMPYATTDSYSNVDTSLNESNESNFNENIPLNEEYKALYERYLMEKYKALERNEDLSLEDYLKDKDVDGLYEKESNVPYNWMVDVEQYDDTLQDNIWLNNYGTPDPNSNISSVPCGGCGALLHCKDHALPGYLPSELFLKKSNQELQVMICQRCHFMRHYNTTLEVKVSADEYPELLKVIKTKKCAVILMVDLTDFPCSIWPEINSVLHPLTPVFVVGNKIDLLPQDSRHFFAHVKDCLSKAVENTGIKKENIRHVALISAKSGYGIEELINKLHAIWKYKGDVYVIGCTNVGKSSLFNVLLQSDYCKVQAVDLIQRATISPWPGTTLNLLKFPILNPNKSRLYSRMLRLKEEQLYKHVEEKFRISQFKTTRKLEYATLQSHIGRTFQSKSKTKVTNDPFAEAKYDNSSMQQFGFDENKEEYKYSRWCYDTPGTIQQDQVLDLLTMQELLSVLPKKIISPRTFILHVNQTIFLGGIGRLDYVEGDSFIRCTIFSSDELPVTLTRTEDADGVYNELLKTEAFVVPENNLDRLKHWPALGSKQIEITGVGRNESIADVVLSSAGWIAIAAKEAKHVVLRAWSPQGRGLHLRMPALLKKSVALRGNRVSDTPTYRSGVQAYKK